MVGCLVLLDRVIKMFKITRGLIQKELERLEERIEMYKADAHKDIKYVGKRLGLGLTEVRLEELKEELALLNEVDE